MSLLKREAEPLPRHTVNRTSSVAGKRDISSSGKMRPGQHRASTAFGRSRPRTFDPPHKLGKLRQRSCKTLAMIARKERQADFLAARRRHNNLATFAPVNFHKRR